LIAQEKFEQAEVLLNSFARAGFHSDEVILAYGLAALRIPVLPVTLPHVMDADRISVIRQVGEAEYLAAKQRRPEASQIYDTLIKRYPTVPYVHYAYGSMQSITQISRKLRSNFVRSSGSTPIA
jgi:hypothetical protein